MNRLEDAERQNEWTNSTGGQAAFLVKLAKETDNLARMAYLFEPELKRRFIDAKALRRELLTFPKRLKKSWEQWALAQCHTGNT